MKILIADDHPIFRSGLKSLLKENFSKATLIESSDGIEALEQIKTEKPDIAIIDINMPGMNGLELLARVVSDELFTRAVILTMYRDSEMMKKAIRLGAFGYLLKDFATREIINCINSVIGGTYYIGPSLEEYFKEYEVEDKKKQEFVTLLKTLSQAELKTLKLVSQNKNTREIAELLFLSEKTIENYRSRICQKLMLPPRNNSLMLWISENKELISLINEFER